MHLKSTVPAPRSYMKRTRRGLVSAQTKDAVKEILLSMAVTIVTH